MYTRYQIDESLTIRYYDSDGLLHREDGPAVQYADGGAMWLIHGQCNRLDGPAIENASGYKAWFYYDRRIRCNSQVEFERLLKLKAFW
jgi:hypothetical protein